MTATTSKTRPVNQKIINFLREHETAVLATVDPNNRPHAVVIYIAVADDLSITFLTKYDTKKSDNLRHNKHAMMTVFDPATQAVVQITGQAEELSDMNEAHQAFRHALRSSLHTSNMAVPPIAKLNAGDYTAFRVTPSDVRMATFTEKHNGKYEQTFEVAEL
ncbi:MAG: pyridoxamine 5'-phosphate oxidase family protein [Candidatus Saccharibacteria bacterium]|nr:pyridoxamine 5'-phosphate oxidase family protein [Candidatus Saccharibacteria bacterium]